MGDDEDGSVADGGKQEMAATEKTKEKPSNSQAAEGQFGFNMRSMAAWVRSKSDLTLPLISAIVLTVLVFTRQLLSRGVNNGYSNLFGTPAGYINIDDVSSTLLLLLLTSGVVFLTVVLLLLVGIFTIKLARKITGVVAAVGVVILCFRYFPAVYAFVVLAIIAAYIALIWALNPLADWVLSKIQARPGSQNSDSASKVKAVRTRIFNLGNTVSYVGSGLLLAFIGAFAINFVGQWAGQNWIGRTPGDQLVSRDASTEAGRTVVLIFINEDKVLERPMFQPEGKNGYFPCGKVVIKSLDQTGIDFQVVKDFGPVHPAPKTGSQSDYSPKVDEGTENKTACF